MPRKKSERRKLIIRNVIEPAYTHVHVPTAVWKGFKYEAKAHGFQPATCLERVIQHVLRHNILKNIIQEFMDQPGENIVHDEVERLTNEDPLTSALEEI